MAERFVASGANGVLSYINDEVTRAAKDYARAAYAAKVDVTDAMSVAAAKDARVVSLSWVDGKEGNPNQGADGASKVARARCGFPRRPTS